MEEEILEVGDLLLDTNMPDYNVMDFIRQKWIQDKANATDPTYDPNSASSWIQHVTKMPEESSQPQVTQPTQKQTPQTPQFKAPVIGPEETKYRQMIQQAPLKSDWHPSKLRSILAGIAGVTSGVLEGPRMGEQIGGYIRNQPYEQKAEEYNQGLNRQGAVAKQEISDVSNAATQGHLAAQSAAEVARKNAEVSRGNRFDYQTSYLAHQRKLEELRVEHPGTSVFHEARFKDKTLHSLKRDSKGQLVDTETNTPVSMNAIDQLSDPNKSLKDTKTANLPAALQGSIAAREIVADESKKGTPEYEAAQDYINELHKGKDPTAAFGAIVQKTNQERAARNQPEMTSAELTSLQKTLQPTPQLPGMVDPNTNTVFRPKPGQVLPPNSRTLQQEGQVNTPTAATRGRGEAAQTAIAAGNDVQSFAAQNKDKLGNLGTYWSNIVQNTPAADPTVEKFRGKVASWAAFQAAAHGFRASTVMKEFEARVGAAKNVDAIISAIQGINDELQHAVDTGKGVKGTENPVSAPQGDLKKMSVDDLLKALK